MAKAVALICKLSAVILTGAALYIYLTKFAVVNISVILGIGLCGLLVSNFALSVDVSKVLESLVQLRKPKE